MIQNNTLSELLTSILTSRSLSPLEIKELLECVSEDSKGENLLEAYLLVLLKRKVTDDEILALIKFLLARAKKLKVNTAFIDVCGTGGDRSNSFNISTATAFIVAAGGVPVLKHGNRSVSSKCGSSDLMEGLGIQLEKAARKSQATLRTLKFGYLHAPFFHPFLSKVAPVRKRIARATVLNFLGPLLHPALPKRQMTGIGNREMFDRYSHWLQKTGRREALVIRGEGGLDEASPYGTTEIIELRNNRLRYEKIRARDFGFRARKLSDIAVHTKSENVTHFRRVLAGKEKGPKKEAVLINAGLAFYLAKKVSRLSEGIRLADDVIQSGRSASLLERYIRVTQ